MPNVTGNIPLTRKQVDDTLDALIKQWEWAGAEGTPLTDPLSDPLIYGAYKLLLHTYQTHPAGITGMLRVMRAIESRLYQLDEGV